MVLLLLLTTEVASDDKATKVCQGQVAALLNPTL